jgi:Fe-S-cluster containining protein
MGGSDLTEKEVKRILKANHPNFFRKIGKDHYEIKSKKGICPYLTKDHSCKIEDTKPLMCKSWPVDPEYKGKKAAVVLMQCPLTPLLSSKQVKDMEKHAGKVLPHIINGGFSKSQLSKSDIDLIYKRYQKFSRSNLA